MINSKRKGKMGELELTAILRSCGYEARRGQQFKGSPDSPDVISSIDGIHIEAKRVEKLNLYAAYEQAKKDAGKDEVPTVWHRRNRTPWMVTIRARDFLALLQRERKAFKEGFSAAYGAEPHHAVVEEDEWRDYKEENP